MQKRAIKTKQSILRTAIKVFSKKGFHGARVDAIAKAARINKERIYAYFGSKEGLYCEALRSVYELIVEEDKKTFLKLTEKNIPDLPQLLVSAYMGFIGKHSEFWRMLAWENLSDKNTRKPLKGLRSETFAHLKRLYKAGQKKGCFYKDVSFESYIFVIIAVSSFYFSNRKTMSQTLGIDLTKDKVKNKMVREIMKVISRRT